MSDCRLYVAIPNYAGVSAVTSISISELNETLLTNRITHQFSYHHDSLITRGRNILVAKMLASDIEFTHLLFLDADVGVQPITILRLLASQFEVCCAVYPRKTDPHAPRSWPMNLAYTSTDGSTGTGQVAQCQRTGFIELRDAPTGCMLIRREALERMMTAYPDTKCTLSEKLLPGSREQKFSYALFDSYIDLSTPAREYISEDYGFCRRWRSIGGRIWADPEAVLDHVGEHTWRGSLRECFACEEAA